MSRVGVATDRLVAGSGVVATVNRGAEPGSAHRGAWECSPRGVDTVVAQRSRRMRAKCKEEVARAAGRAPVPSRPHSCGKRGSVWLSPLAAWGTFLWLVCALHAPRLAGVEPTMLGQPDSVVLEEFAVEPQVWAHGADGFPTPAARDVQTRGDHAGLCPEQVNTAAETVEEVPEEDDGVDKGIHLLQELWQALTGVIESTGGAGRSVSSRSKLGRALGDAKAWAAAIDEVLSEVESAGALSLTAEEVAEWIKAGSGVLRQLSKVKKAMTATKREGRVAVVERAAVGQAAAGQVEDDDDAWQALTGAWPRGVGSSSEAGQ